MVYSFSAVIERFEIKEKKNSVTSIPLSLSLFSWLSMLPKLLAVKKFVLI